MHAHRKDTSFSQMGGHVYRRRGAFPKSGALLYPRQPYGLFQRMRRKKHDPAPRGPQEPDRSAGSDPAHTLAMVVCAASSSTAFFSSGSYTVFFFAFMSAIFHRLKKALHTGQPVRYNQAWLEG